MWSGAMTIYDYLLYGWIFFYLPVFAREVWKEIKEELDRE